MARIRTIKPEFFRHFGLYQLERETGLPIRTAFSGLWTASDREGRFKWRQEELKLDCLPYDPVDFGDVLDALERGGFIVRYEVDGELYGVVPGFNRHQSINQREAASRIPEPDESAVARARTCMHVHARGDGKGREGKGKSLVDFCPNSATIAPTPPQSAQEPDPPPNPAPAPAQEPAPEPAAQPAPQAAPKGAVAGPQAAPPPIRSGEGISSTPPDQLPLGDSAVVHKHPAAPPINEAVKLWNDVLGPKLGRVAKLTDARRKHLRARLVDLDNSIERWRQYLDWIQASPFLMGENDRGWRADFDFAIRESSFVKVTEGRYKKKAAVKPRKEWETTRLVDDEMVRQFVG